MHWNPKPGRIQIGIHHRWPSDVGIIMLIFILTGDSDGVEMSIELAVKVPVLIATVTIDP